MGCERSDLVVRSIDHYGEETQVRYERDNQAVARLIVAAAVTPMGQPGGNGSRAVSVRIGSGSEDVHTVSVPETDEIDY
jgi:hypothetical protein